MPELVINTSEWNEGFRALRQFEPTLARGLRRTLKGLGGEAAGAVQKAVRLPSPTSADKSRGAREELAKNTKVSVSFGARTAGVKVTTRGGFVGNFAGAYNTPKFRHPVFGQDRWVNQPGRPYFRKAIIPVIDQKLLKQMSNVADEAFRAIGATT